MGTKTEHGLARLTIESTSLSRWVITSNAGDVQASVDVMAYSTGVKNALADTYGHP
jgi:hypothetical protein